MTPLRDYQQELVESAREGLKTHKRLMIQLPTGGGKSAIYAEIVKLAYGNNNSAWIIEPRRELVRSMSKHLEKWHVPHGKIMQSSKESKAFKVHVVSKDTLIRRLEKTKNAPRLILVDEAHLAVDAIKKIIQSMPDYVRVIGCSATPERMDGKSLADVYETLITGKSMPWLVGRGFLSPCRYFAPPDIDITKLKFTHGEVDATELDKILQKEKIYGKCVDYYSKMGKGRVLLGFCRDIKSAKQTAKQFQDAGFKVYEIDGSMPDKKQQALMEAARKREIDGLICADLILYGVDIPAISYVFFLRPTQSRALFMQMCGRAMRVCEGKDDAIIVDHCNNYQIHNQNGIPIIFCENIDWQFNGRQKKSQEKMITPTYRLCQYNNFEYCAKLSCAGCELKPENESDPREALVIDVPLVEKKAADNYEIITDAERREYQDAVIRYAEAARCAADEDALDKAVRQLCDIAAKLGYREMWVYHQINTQKYVIDVRVLHSIARVKGYRNGWVFYKRKELRESMKEAV